MRAAAEEAGRDPAEIKVMACAPAHVSDDMADACEQVRWFPAMVSNHVFDLLAKHDKATLPAALTDYVERMQREQYDYSEHSRVGAEHGQQVSDETCERFCVLGTPEQHVEKLRRLEAAGVDQWNIYLMTSGQEETLEAYGREIIPELRYGDGHALDGVVRVAAEVPRGLERLLVPAASRARQQSSYSPAIAFHSNVHRRHAHGEPRSSSSSASSHVAPPSVETSTSSSSPRPDHARPSSRHGPAGTIRLRVGNSGKPGGAISARGSIRDSGSPLVLLGLAQPVGVRLLIALERTVDRRDALEPLHARHAVPAGDEQAEREAVLRRERGTVHLVCEEDLGPVRVEERKAALVRLLDASFQSLVETGEHELDRVIRHAGLRQQAAQRRPSPVRGAHGLLQPRLADDVRLDQRAPVSGAFHRHRQLHRRPRTQLVQ